MNMFILVPLPDILKFLLRARQLSSKLSDLAAILRLQHHMACPMPYSLLPSRVKNVIALIQATTPDSS